MSQVECGGPVAPIKVIVRGYGAGLKVFEHSADIDPEDFDGTIEAMAEVHVQALKCFEVFMVEFEFPDAPENERFLRFGTDPRGMVMPVEVPL